MNVDVLTLKKAMKKQLLTLLGLLALSTATLAQVPNYVPANGLVGWWPFNGNANDESGNGNNGTVSGATLTLDRDGNSNAAYEFDGINNLITIPHASSFNISEMSVSVWALKDNQAIYNPGILSKCETNNLGWYIITNSNQSDSVSFNGAVATSDYFHANSAAPIVNEWVHIVSTYNQGSQKIFINGSLTDEDTNPGSLYVFSGGLYVGFKNGDNYWGGKIDDIGIWNVALTEEEVTDLYEAVDAPCIVSSAVSFSGLNANYTISDGTVSLMGAPAGGVFFGEGIWGNEFDPAVAGIGTHSIVYTYLDGNGCIGSYGLCTTVDVGVNVEGTNIGVDNGIDVYPNPSKGLYSISIGKIDGIVELNVIDVRGREVYNKSMVVNGQLSAHQIDLSGFANGVYTLSVRSANGTSAQKLIKE